MRASGAMLAKATLQPLPIDDKVGQSELQISSAVSPLDLDDSAARANQCRTQQTKL
jgi:hypothetical protein